MKIYAAILALCLGISACVRTAVANSHETIMEFTFADLEWGSDRSAVKKQLATEGFKFVKMTKSNQDLGFSGVLVGRQAFVAAFFANDRLARVDVILETSSRGVYRILKESLTEKYGPPAPPARYRLLDPTDPPDKIRVEDRAIWRSRQANGVMILDTPQDIGGRLNVRISYQSPLWADEAARRRAEETKLF